MALNLWRKIFGAPPVVTNEPARPPAREKKERRVEARELPPFDSGAATEASPKHPDVNQDAYAVDAGRHLMMVADGVSGSAKGEVASGAAREAVARLGEALDDMVQDAREATGSPYLTIDQASEVMDRHFRLMADRVKAASDAGKTGNTRAATTLMTAKMFETAPGETYAVVKSVGDCQPMVLRADGRLERVDIAEDSMFAERIRRGQLSEDEAYLIAESGSVKELTRAFLEYQAELGSIPPGVTDPAEISGSPVGDDLARVLKLFNQYYSGARQERSVITEFVGGKAGNELNVHSAVVRLNPGDQLFLSTDGIDALKRAEVRDALSRGVSVEQKARMLVAAAKKANEKGDLRAKPDDITVVGMEVPRPGRPGQRLKEVGFEEDVDYAQGTLEDLRHSLDAFYAAHPQLADLAVLEAGGADPKTRGKYTELVNKYARNYPGGIEGLKRDAQPFLAEVRAKRAKMEAMQSELTLAQARQQLFETQRDALADDPESPVWRRRVENAEQRVTQLKRLSEMSRAQADVQGVEAARSRARVAAEKVENS